MRKDGRGRRATGFNKGRREGYPKAARACPRPRVLTVLAQVCREGRAAAARSGRARARNTPSIAGVQGHWIYQNKSELSFLHCGD